MPPTTHLQAREIRDPVHGFVKLSLSELALVNCPVYQRLRDIRQLAMAHMVYPGANHTRFEHSLGCVHLSSAIFRAIKQRVEAGECPSFHDAFRINDHTLDRGEQILRLASLLHDLGHSPFSHTGEGLMSEIAGDGKVRPIDHEQMTARLIRGSRIKEVLDTHFGSDGISTEEVISVATKPSLTEPPNAFNTPWHVFLRDILTGELGSDRMDYLLRDAHHSGQEAGHFDFRKLIDSMVIVPPPEETGSGHRLGIDGGGWLVAEQMVAVRYLMYVALYFHKTKRIYEIHLTRFVREWLNRKFGQPVFPVDRPQDYAKLTDSSIISEIFEAASSKDHPLQALALPFVDRSHLRLAREVVLADNCVPETKNGRRIADKARLDLFEKAVRIKFGDRVLLDKLEHGATKMFSGSKILVLLDGRPRYLDELSELVRGMSAQIWRARVYSDPEIRKDVKAFCDSWLLTYQSKPAEPDDVAEKEKGTEEIHAR